MNRFIIVIAILVPLAVVLWANMSFRGENESNGSSGVAVRNVSEAILIEDQYCDEVTGENFDRIVVQCDKPVLLDCWAPHCTACFHLRPFMKELANEYDGRVVFGRINVDESKDLVRELQIQGIPLVLMFNDGVPVRRVSGFRSETPERIQQLIEKMLAKRP